MTVLAKHRPDDKRILRGAAALKNELLQQHQPKSIIGQERIRAETRAIQQDLLGESMYVSSEEENTSNEDNHHEHLDDSILAADSPVRVSPRQRRDPPTSRRALTPPSPPSPVRETKGLNESLANSNASTPGQRRHCVQDDSDDYGFVGDDYDNELSDSVDLNTRGMSFFAESEDSPTAAAATGSTKKKTRGFSFFSSPSEDTTAAESSICRKNQEPSSLRPLIPVAHQMARNDRRKSPPFEVDQQHQRFPEVVDDSDLIEAKAQSPIREVLVTDHSSNKEKGKNKQLVDTAEDSVNVLLSVDHKSTRSGSTSDSSVSSLGSGGAQHLHQSHQPVLDYSILLADPAYRHACQAGFLWQSLVGQHVRFPKHWWNGARTPPMGDIVAGRWEYVTRTTVHSHPLLQRLVKNRAASGRLVLHLKLTKNDPKSRREKYKKGPVDVCVGVVHPNARGIRLQATNDPRLEASRVVWMAVRRPICEDNLKYYDTSIGHQDSTTLKQYGISSSPLGAQGVTNSNVRVVFGEQPPVETVVLPYTDVAKRLDLALNNKMQQQQHAVALDLLEEFVFS